MEDAILEEALDLLSDATAQQRSWVLDKLSDVYMGLTLKEDVEEQEEHDARPVPVGGHDVALCANLGTMLAVGERAMIAKRAGDAFLFEIVKFHEWKDLPDLDKINWRAAKGAMMARVRWCPRPSAGLDFTRCTYCTVDLAGESIESQP